MRASVLFVLWRSSDGIPRPFTLQTLLYTRESICLSYLNLSFQIDRHRKAARENVFMHERNTSNMMYSYGTYRKYPKKNKNKFSAPVKNGKICSQYMCRLQNPTKNFYSESQSLSERGIMTKTEKPRKCKTCGETFVPSGNHQRYCTPCSRERRNSKLREYVETHNRRYQGGGKL